MVVRTVEVAKDALDGHCSSAVLLYLCAAEGYEAMLTYRQYLLVCGLCCFSPCHSMKQLLFFNPLKP